MKKYIIIPLVLIGAIASPAFAAITYTRTGGVVNVSADSFADFSPGPGDNFWDITIQYTYNGQGCTLFVDNSGNTQIQGDPACLGTTPTITNERFYASTSLAITQTFTLPSQVSDYQDIYTCTGVADPEECNGGTQLEGAFTYSQGGGFPTAGTSTIGDIGGAMLSGIITPWKYILITFGPPLFGYGLLAVLFFGLFWWMKKLMARDK